MMQRPGVLVAALALGFSAAAHANSFDYVLWQNSPKWSGAVMKWHYNPANQPAAVTTDSMVSLIQGNMAKWSSECGIRFEYQGTTSAPPTLNDQVNVIGWSSANGYDGFTQYWYRGAYYSDVDIRLDPTRLTATNTIDAILNHELGHAVGLDHSDEAAAIMFANPYHSYEYQRTLRADDMEGCQALYGKAAVAATSTPHSFSMNASGPNSALNLNARITIASADRNTTGNIYLAAHIGNAWLVNNGSAWVSWNGGALPVYFSGTLSDRDIVVASALDGTALAGGQIIVGYGKNDADMLSNQRYSTIYTFSR